MAVMALSAFSDVQPRYANYCLAHGALSADEMVARDTKAHPGGKMGGFIIWIGARWRDWERETGWNGAHHTEEDHAAFDAWLTAKVAAEIAAESMVA